MMSFQPGFKRSGKLLLALALVAGSTACAAEASQNTPQTGAATRSLPTKESGIAPLSFLVGSWQGKEDAFASDGSGRVVSSIDQLITGHLVPDLANKYLMLTKHEHLELYAYDGINNHYRMWSYSANRARVKEWSGVMEDGALVLYLQQEDSGTILARVEFDKDGSYRIIDPVDGGPAAAAGLQTGDRIVAVEGVRVTAENQATLLGSAKGAPGSAMKISVKRGEREWETSIVRGGKPTVRVVISATPQGPRFEYQLLRGTDWRQVSLLTPKGA